MAKMNSFIIENIETISEKEILITIKLGQSAESFTVTMLKNSSVSIPENLELIFLDKDFNYHREFFKIITDYRAGISIEFPITLFDRSKLRKDELQAA